jgi:hypothetical protein
VTTSTAIPDILSAPLDPDWTIEGLAEKVVGTVAAQPLTAQEFVIVVDDSTDRQSRRLIRPLLAYLATKSARESGTPVNLYAGRLSFERHSPVGSGWIIGEFENRPGSVRLALRRSGSPAASDEGSRTDAGTPGRTEGVPVAETPGSDAPLPTSRIR